MALSERFFQQKPKAWDLFAPLAEPAHLPRGYDPTVAGGIYDHYRTADRDSDAEKGSAALAAYLHAAYSSDQIAKLSPEQDLAVSYFVTGFFLHIANSLDSLALWMADACDIMQSARSRPSLTGVDFLARLALIDIAAQTKLKRERPWMEEAQAYRWLARSRNSLLWNGESGEIVISSTAIRSSETPRLGDVSSRSSKPAPAGELCPSYLSRLASVSRTVFEAGAPRLPHRKAR
ncbi:MAG: hypothetical protein OXG11_05570 [Chloroflexi bacterium]|nr:hypothetical protein [Chloroflexota bacterium]